MRYIIIACLLGLCASQGLGMENVPAGFYVSRPANEHDIEEFCAENPYNNIAEGNCTIAQIGNGWYRCECVR